MEPLLEALMPRIHHCDQVACAEINPAVMCPSDSPWLQWRVAGTGLKDRYKVRYQVASEALMDTYIVVICGTVLKKEEKQQATSNLSTRIVSW